jgi:3-dehydroquinate synthase
MTELTVRASGTYTVRLERGALSNLGRLLPEKPRAAAIIAEEAVDRLYGDRAAAGLEAAGIRVERVTFPGGEAEKCGRTLFEILEFLAERKLSRGDMLVALGGGVTGDLTGFAAAVYLRGVPFVQVPTTLLAMVDASVGGKTAVNLNAGKNLAGAFHQPAFVAIDPDALMTLPPEVLADGVAEAVKCGVIGDADLFKKLAPGFDLTDAEETIARCVALKRDLVEADERDTGERQLLNFGHTVGHAVEKASGYAISHGRAVALGMVAEARGAYLAGFAEEDCSGPIREALIQNHLPVACPFPAEALLEAMLRDKKVRDHRIQLALPKRIGRCALYEIDVDALGGFLARALEHP